MRSDAVELPYDCVPRVYISVVIELLTVCQHNQPKPKTQQCTSDKKLRDDRQ